MIHPNLTTDFGDLFSYNTVRFENPLYKTKVQSEPVYDSADRMVVGIRHTIETSAYIIAGSNETDETLEELRKKLTEPGKELIYQDKGFGALVVNSEDSDVEDIQWGPKPKLMTFVPIGGSRTALVQWRVSTVIPECDDAHYRNQLMAGCWGIEWDIDGQGYTTITYAGYIEIPITFDQANLRRLRDNADRFREQLLGTVPAGMRRETQRWRLSMDRRRLDFHVVDRQLPVPLPKGIPYADVKHKVSSTLQHRGFSIWDNIISGTLQVTPTEPKWLAWTRFKLIAFKRMRRVHENAGSGVPVRTAGLFTQLIGGPGGTAIDAALHATGIRRLENRREFTANIIVQSYEFTEPIFKWESSFQIHYQIVGSPLDAILTHSGLWTTPPSGMLGPRAGVIDSAIASPEQIAAKPLAEADYDSWRESVKKAQSQRGVAGYKFNNASDALIDLCLDKTNLPLMTPIQGPSRSPTRVVRDDEDAPANDEAWPRPENSWIWWQSETVYREDDHIVRHKPLRGEVTQRPPRTNGTGTPNTNGNDRYLPRFNGSVPDIIQRVSAPSNIVSLIGFAIRYGYRIAPPELVTIQGRPVTQLAVPIMAETLLNVVGGVPIFRLDWRIDYTIGETMADLPLPVLSNPFYNATGGDGSQTFQNPVQKPK